MSGGGPRAIDTLLGVAVSIGMGCVAALICALVWLILNEGRLP